MMRRLPLMLGLVALAVPAAAQQGAKPPASPPPPPRPGTTAPRDFDDWKVACEKAVGREGQVCFAFQQLRYEPSKRTLGTISIGYPAPGRPALAILTLPLGMLIPTGAVLQVDGASPPVKADAPIKVCYAEGCRAEMTFSPAMATAFRQRESARVVFMNIDDNLIELPVSLKGFGRAFESLQ